MPRIGETWFDERFASRRSGLVETVRQHLYKQQPGLEAVGIWLDTDYSEPKVRGILERRRQEYRLQDAGQPTPPDGRRIPGSGYRDPGLPGDGLRADRLEQAFTALHGQNQGGDLLRLLGRNLPQNERKTNALRAVVVSACIVDPDADEWLTPVTPLASCPWRGDSRAAPPVKGRADVARLWGHEALRLLREACSVLGWEPAADSNARHEAAVSAALNRYPTLLAALIYLGRRNDIRPTTHTEREGGNEHRSHVAGEPIAFALKWVHGRCTWQSQRNGAELWDYVDQSARGGIVDAKVREAVVPELRAVDTAETRRAFWSELLSHFPHIANDLLASAPAPTADDLHKPATKARRKAGGEKWRKAQKRMRDLVQKGKLPQTLRQAAKLLQAEGFKYNAVRTAAHKSRTLQAHFKLGSATDDPNGTASSILDELAQQADRRTQQAIRSMSPQERAKVEAALNGMPASNALELVKTLAHDPDAGRTADVAYIEEADQDDRDDDE